jgi:5-methylcytosine-specific restriction protein B
MIPPGIDRQHVEAALREINEKGIPSGREAAKWELVHDGKHYPPKYTLGLAARFALGSELGPSEFSGGPETNDFLRSLGFEIVAKQSASVRELLGWILEEYPTARQSAQFGKDHEIWATFTSLETAFSQMKSVQAFPKLRIKWSVGQGTWAKVPWIAFLDTRETPTTQRGVYCVFLFRQDSSGVYLTLQQGVTDPREKMGATEGRAFLRSKADEIRQKHEGLSQRGFLTDGSIDLHADPGLGSEYEASTISHKLYEKGRIPSDKDIEQDLALVLTEYSKYVSGKNAVNTWIFQASPKYYDIQGAIRSLKQQTWTVAQFKDKIRSGDRVYVWESGQDAGILGIATIVTEPAKIEFPEQENPFVRGKEKFAGLHTAVTIRIDRVLSSRLSRKKLLEDPILKDLSVITFPRGTNFAVTSGQSKRIAEVLGEENQAIVDVGGPPMSIALNLILYGPPGTGKTYWAMRKAVEICDGVLPEDDLLIQERYKKLREENRMDLVTFHQSYGYEDFIEGIRPVLAKGEGDEGLASGVVRYECRDGAFKRMCSFATTSVVIPGRGVTLDLSQQRVWKMSLGDTSKSDQAEVYDQCIESHQIRLGYGMSLDFTGCDDRQAVAAKHREAKESIKDGDFSIDAVNRFKNEMQIGDLVVVSDGNLAFRAIGRITGTYSALPEITDYRQMRPVEWLLVLDKSLPADRILTRIFSQATIYQLREKVLRADALRELLSGETKARKNYVLIIDEINRGNIAKIFGELISLIEADKRIGAANEIRATLPYSGEQFGVPENLFILGTMNTADRSIAFLDTALRRRFRFEEMMPNSEIIRRNIGQNGVVDSIDIAALVDEINARIEYLFDRDHRIGHAYFLAVKSLSDLLDVFRFQVVPLLQEYFYGDWPKICTVLGCPHDPATGKSLTKNPLPMIKVGLCDAVAGDMEDGGEARFHYELNSMLELDGANLVECFRWVKGVPADSVKLPNLAGNPATERA